MPSLKSYGKPYGQGNGDGPGPASLLLPATKEPRAQFHSTLYQKKPNAHRSVKLVGTCCQGCHTEVVEVNRDAPHGLHAISVNSNASQGSLGHQILNRLNCTRLVVGEHQGCKSRV